MGAEPVRMRPEGRKSDRRAAAPRLPVACALALAACQGRGHGPDPLPSNLPPPPPFTSKRGARRGRDRSCEKLGRPKPEYRCIREPRPERHWCSAEPVSKRGPWVVAVRTLVTRSSVIPFRRLSQVTQPCSRMLLKYQGGFGEAQEGVGEEGSPLAATAGAGKSECGGDRLRIRDALRRRAGGARSGTDSVLQDIHRRSPPARRLGGLLWGQDRGHGSDRRLLDPGLRDPRVARPRGSAGECPAREERAGPKERRQRLRMVTGAAQRWAAQGQLSTRR